MSLYKQQLPLSIMSTLCQNMKNFVTKTQTFYDYNMNPKIKQTDKSKKGF